MGQKTGKRYPEEFKKQIVDLYNTGIPVVELASEYGLIEQTIYKWIKFYSNVTETDEGKTVSISMKEFKELQKRWLNLKWKMKYKKSYSHIHQKTLNEIIAFIIKYCDQYPIKIMCKVLGIRRSTYYKKRNWIHSKRKIQKLDTEIKKIYFDSKNYWMVIWKTNDC